MPIVVVSLIYSDIDTCLIFACSCSIIKKRPICEFNLTILLFYLFICTFANVKLWVLYL